MSATAQHMTGHVMLKVLLVEDSRVLAERLIELIHQTAAADLVGHVDNEKDAINFLKRQSIDVVILDLQLKQGTGFGVLKSLTDIQYKPQVLVLTNYDLPEYRRQATQLGANYFLDKSREYHRVTEILDKLATTPGGGPYS
jgi:two-component system, OmpR family, response regulator